MNTSQHSFTANSLPSSQLRSANVPASGDNVQEASLAINMEKLSKPVLVLPVETLLRDITTDHAKSLHLPSISNSSAFLLLLLASRPAGPC